MNITRKEVPTLSIDIHIQTQINRVLTLISNCKLKNILTILKVLNSILHVIAVNKRQIQTNNLSSEQITSFRYRVIVLISALDRQLLSLTHKDLLKAVLACIWEGLITRTWEDNDDVRGVYLFFKVFE